MGMDACAKLLFGFPIVIEDNEELHEAINDGQFPFIWKNPSEFTNDIYIRFASYSAHDYTPSCLGTDIPSSYNYSTAEAEEFCEKHKIPFEAPQWYLIPYYF